jgi:hypothetical protein
MNATRNGLRRYGTPRQLLGAGYFHFRQCRARRHNAAIGASVGYASPILGGPSGERYRASGLVDNGANISFFQ